MGDWVGLAIGAAVVVWLFRRPRSRSWMSRADQEARRRRQATRSGLDDDFDGFGAG